MSPEGFHFDQGRIYIRTDGSNVEERGTRYRGKRIASSDRPKSVVVVIRNPLRIASFLTNQGITVCVCSAALLIAVSK